MTSNNTQFAIDLKAIWAKAISTKYLNDSTRILIKEDRVIKSYANKLKMIEERSKEYSILDDYYGYITLRYSPDIQAYYFYVSELNDLIKISPAIPPSDEEILIRQAKKKKQEDQRYWKSIGFK